MVTVRAGTERPWRLRAAVTCLAALGVVGCWHGWDDYEAPSPDEESSPAPRALCSDLCTAYEHCIGASPDCLDECEPQVAQCAPAQLTMLEECVDELEDCDYPATAPVVFNSCLVAVGCYSPP
jgi:hypothetical protein